jgi:hypothetical protein
MIVSARARRSCSRRFSRCARAKARLASSTSPAARPLPVASNPASRCRRQSVRCEEYSPSRRSRVPISPLAQRSASASTRSLYAVVNRRRPARGRSSGSGPSGTRPPAGTVPATTAFSCPSPSTRTPCVPET